MERIRRGPKERAKFVASHVDKGIAYQIRALRERQDLSQEKLAELAGMNQNAISRLESPTRGRPTITTLKRLAETFDVALVVRFVPFRKLAKWVSGTPYREDGLNSEALGVPGFEEEEKQEERALVANLFEVFFKVSQLRDITIPEPVQDITNISGTAIPMLVELETDYYRLNTTPQQQRVFYPVIEGNAKIGE